MSILTDTPHTKRDRLAHAKLVHDRAARLVQKLVTLDQFNGQSTARTFAMAMVAEGEQATQNMEVWVASYILHTFGEEAAHTFQSAFQQDFLGLPKEATEIPERIVDDIVNKK